MMVLRNLGVKKQLIVLTVSAFIGLILVFGVSVVQTNRVYNEANFANENTVPALEHLGKLNSLSFMSGILLHEFNVYQGNDQKVAETEKNLRDVENGIIELMNQYERQFALKEDKVAIARMKESYRLYNALAVQLFEHIKEGRDDDFLKLMPKIEEKGKAFFVEIGNMINKEMTIGREASKKAESIGTVNNSVSIW